MRAGETRNGIDDLKQGFARLHAAGS